MYIIRVDYHDGLVIVSSSWPTFKFFHRRLGSKYAATVRDLTTSQMQPCRLSQYLL